MNGNPWRAVVRTVGTFLTGLALAPMAAAEPPPREGSVALFPLAEGNRWVWEVRERTGGGARFLLFLPTSPGTEARIGTWTLTVGGEATRRGRRGWQARLVRAEDGVGSTEEELFLWPERGRVWMEGPQGSVPAVEAMASEDGVSVERIPCVAHVLGGLAASCSPAPGGPLGVPPGPDRIVLSSDFSSSTAMAQFLVGVMTAGVIIPGHRHTTRTAELVEWTPAPAGARWSGSPWAPVSSPLVEAWLADPPGPFDDPVQHLAGLLQSHPVDAEAATSLVTRVQWGEEEAVALGLLPALPIGERLPLVRVMVARAPLGDELRTLARASAHLVLPVAERRVSSLLAGLGDAEAETARRLLSGEHPLLTAMLAAAVSSHDSDVLAALEVEAGRFRLTEAEALAVIEHFSFDDDRRAAFDLVLPGTAEAKRPAVIAETLARLTFDEAKLEIITARAGTLRRLPRERRLALLDLFPFAEERARAADLMGVPSADGGR